MVGYGGTWGDTEGRAGAQRVMGWHKGIWGDTEGYGVTRWWLALGTSKSQPNPSSTPQEHPQGPGSFMGPGERREPLAAPSESPERRESHPKSRQRGRAPDVLANGHGGDHLLHGLLLLLLLVAVELGLQLEDLPWGRGGRAGVGTGPGSPPKPLRAGPGPPSPFLVVVKYLESVMVPLRLLRGEIH